MDPREKENRDEGGVQTCGRFMLPMILPFQNRVADLRSDHEVDAVDVCLLWGGPEPLDCAVAWGYTFAS